MASTRSSPTAEVVCSECGEGCGTAAAPAVTRARGRVRPRSQLRKWWLERFTLDELRAWPPL